MAVFSIYTFTSFPPSISSSYFHDFTGDLLSRAWIGRRRRRRSKSKSKATTRLFVLSSHSNPKILKSNRRSRYGQTLSPYDSDDDAGGDGFEYDDDWDEDDWLSDYTKRSSSDRISPKPKKMDHGGGAAPTGCYKCGRPGHWSRDCPSNPNQNPNPNPNPNSSPNYSKPNSSTFNGGGFGGSKPLQKSSEKPKKVPRTRPKLTPELLLSNDGIGYVLRHFPRSFKYRGRGHEFIHKVEQVGATRRVKTCLGGLRDRVANGGDPTMLHEHSVEQNISNNDQEAMNIEEPSLVQEDTSLKNHDTDDLQEDMLQEIYKQTTEGPSPALHGDSAATDTTSHHTPVKDLPNQVNQAPDNMSSISRDLQVSEEQKARMEANRLKALERAAARARSSQTA